jgi:hypothetical protein
MPRVEKNPDVTERLGTCSGSPEALKLRSGVELVDAATLSNAVF